MSDRIVSIDITITGTVPVRIVPELITKAITICPETGVLTITVDGGIEQ